MKFGFIIPHNYGLSDPQDVLDIAVKAEELGFDSVWVNHHVLHAGYILDRLGDKPYYDCLTVLTYVAAITSRVGLGTTVLVLPYLNPLVLAKTLATLDVMSGGRLRLGVGVGTLKHESDSLGAQFEGRGHYADESISVMKALWTQENPTFEGDHFSFTGIKFSPKPRQDPHPPILIGGMSRPALRRVARLGDGWHPNGVSPDGLDEPLGYLRQQLEAEGRKLSDIQLSVRNELSVLDSSDSSPGGPMVGTPDELFTTIENYAGKGVSEIVFQVSTDDVPRIHRTMESFASKVMPRVSRG